jgi:putative heme-binding domain-containing protein
LQRIAWLRVHELALLRLGPVAPAQRAALCERLLPLFPSGAERADQQLCALLANLDAPGLLDKAVPLLAEMQPAPPPPWAQLAARNRSYGGAITAMLQAMPPTMQIGIANALRTVRAGWTLEQRRQYFACLAAARTRRGGASYDGYLGAIVDAAWATCSAAEQAELAEVIGRARAEPEPFVATPPKGPGRNWQLADAVAIAKAGLGHRRADFAAGHNLFFAAGCASCHRFAGEGRGLGPDLTSLGNKFTVADVLEAILEPSKVVSDQFAGAVLTRTDGTTLFGRVGKHDENGELVYEVVTATAEASIVQVRGSDVRSVEAATLSPMPTGLVDRLGEGELLDLLSFLLSRGEHPADGPTDASGRR